MHQVINLNSFACTIKSDLQILQLFFYAFVVVVFFLFVLNLLLHIKMVSWTDLHFQANKGWLKEARYKEDRCQYPDKELCLLIS